MKDKYRKSIFYRAIKLALISSVIIISLMIYKLLTTDVVGTPLEAFIRFVISCLGVVGGTWLIFVVYLYFNPDADKPTRKRR